MKKIKYRIISSRPGEAPQVSEESIFEGVDVEACDAQAKKRLEELAGQKSNAWDNLSLERVDVEEVTTHIARNVTKDHTPEAERRTILCGEPNPFEK